MNELDFGRAMSDFLIIFQSDSFTGVFETFMFFWLNFYFTEKGYRYALFLLFLSILPLKGLFNGIRDEEGLDGEGNLTRNFYRMETAFSAVL